MVYFFTMVMVNILPLNFSWEGFESVMMSGIILPQPCTGRSRRMRGYFYVSFDQSKFWRWRFHWFLLSSHPSASYEMIADGEEHRVELLAIKKNFTMRVDGGKARSIINDGEKDMLKLTTPLFLGGLPSNVAATALNLWHLRNSTSFHGEEWIHINIRTYIEGKNKKTWSWAQVLQIFLLSLCIL